MTYGIEILTSTGREASDALNTFGIFYTLHCTTETGSATIAEFDSDVGFYVPIIQDTLYFQNFSWNNTTKLFTWSKAISGTHSTNFNVVFFRGSV